ncbi:MAG: hypothetical protein ACR2NL_09365 [Acidimicrobiia bacterium]
MMQSSNRRAGQQRPPVIALGGFLPTLAIMRSLGPRGVSVHVLGDDAAPSRSIPETLRFSRYCVDFIPFVEDVEAGWFQWLTEAQMEGAVVIPCSDPALEFVAQYRTALQGLGYHPVPADDSVVLDMLDKERAYALARNLGISTPLSHVIRQSSDIDDALAVMDLPAVVKPLSKGDFYEVFGWKAREVSTRGELHDVVRDSVRAGHALQLGELIPGAEDLFCSYYSFLDEAGEPLVHFTKRKLRQYPLGFGWGTFHVTDWNEEVAEAGLRFFRGAGLRGIGNVEFKRDPRDGQLKLIECNPRLTDSTELISQSGIDFPFIGYMKALGLNPPTTDRYVEGMTLWRPSKDTVAAWQLWRRGELSPVRWASQIAQRHRYPIFSWRDVKPALMASVYRLRSIAHVLR